MDFDKQKPILYKNTAFLSNYMFCLYIFPEYYIKGLIFFYDWIHTCIINTNHQTVGSWTGGMCHSSCGMNVECCCDWYRICRKKSMACWMMNYVGLTCMNKNKSSNSCIYMYIEIMYAHLKLSKHIMIIGQARLIRFLY